MGRCLLWRVRVANYKYIIDVDRKEEEPPRGMGRGEWPGG